MYQVSDLDEERKNSAQGSTSDGCTVHEQEAKRVADEKG